MQPTPHSRARARASKGRQSQNDKFTAPPPQPPHQRLLLLLLLAAGTDAAITRAWRERAVASRRRRRRRRRRRVIATAILLSATNPYGCVHLQTHADVPSDHTYSTTSSRQLAPINGGYNHKPPIYLCNIGTVVYYSLVKRKTTLMDMFVPAFGNIILVNIEGKSMLSYIVLPH